MIDTEEVAARHRPLITRIARRVLRSPEDVEDAVMTTLAAVHASRGTYDASKGEMTTWVGRIAFAAAVEILRANGRARRTESREVARRNPSRDVLRNIEGDARVIAELVLSIPAETAGQVWREAKAAASSMGWTWERIMAAKADVGRYLSGRTA